MFRDTSSKQNFSRNGGGFRGRNNGGGFKRGGGFNRGPRPARKHVSTVRLDSLVKKAVARAEAVPYTSTHKFSDFKIDEKLKQNIEKKGYVTPTPIQDQAIPHVLEGKDVVGVANTGTGKSAAFLIPLIQKVIEKSWTKILVVVPTRELAVQIHDELNSFIQGLKVSSLIAVGGTSVNSQIHRLNRPHNFVIGTPGRLKDMSDRGVLKLDEFSTVVLDEVDRMLDMGFINDMKYLIGKFPKERHSLFFSATLAGEIQEILKIFSAEHTTISVRQGETSDNVEQDVIKVFSREEKSAKLKQILQAEDAKRTIIFVRTKHGADRLHRILYKQGFKVNAIHGDKRQNQRMRTIEDFKSGKIHILVATDVAARGLDIPDVTHVINYDLPATQDDYVHRIGRTGRGSNGFGIALTFVEDFRREDEARREEARQESSRRDGFRADEPKHVIEPGNELVPPQPEGGFRRDFNRNRRPGQRSYGGGNGNGNSYGGNRNGNRSQSGNSYGNRRDNRDSRFGNRSNDRSSDRSGGRANYNRSDGQPGDSLF